MAKSLLTPQGIVNLTIPQLYRVSDILDFDDASISAFAKMLYLSEPKRYQILYTLAVNNLLTVPTDLISGIANLSITGASPGSLSWVLKNRETLILMDSLITQGNNNTLVIQKYNLTFTGKRSDLFGLILNFTATSTVPLNKSFEQSFHLLPDKFIGSTDRIGDHNAFRASIRKQIEPGFTLNTQTIERTFQLIDQVYFANLLKYRLLASGKTISFYISNRMVGTAGSMSSKDSVNEYEITISSRLEDVLGAKSGNGVVCEGPIDAFIVTLQHEMTHLIVHLEMDRLGITNVDLITKNKNLTVNPSHFSSHGLIFQSIAERFFGLTERTHRLFEKGEGNDGPAKEPGSRSIAPGLTAATTPVTNITVDSQVSFTLKGRVVTGKVIKTNPKKAKVILDNNEIWNVSYGGLKLV